MPSPEIQIIPPASDRRPGLHDDVARLRLAMPDLVVHVLPADRTRPEGRADRVQEAGDDVAGVRSRQGPRRLASRSMWRHVKGAVQTGQL